MLRFGFGQLGLERGHVARQRFGGFAGGCKACFQRRDLRVGFIQQAKAFIVAGLQIVVDLLLLLGGGVQLRGGSDHGFVFGELGFVFGLHARGSGELVRKLLLVLRELLHGVVRHAGILLQPGNRGVLFLQRGVRVGEGGLRVRQRLLSLGQPLGGFAERIVFLGDGLIQRCQLLDGVVVLGVFLLQLLRQRRAGRPVLCALILFIIVLHVQKRIACDGKRKQNGKNDNDDLLHLWKSSPPVTRAWTRVSFSFKYIINA